MILRQAPSVSQWLPDRDALDGRCADHLKRIHLFGDLAVLTAPHGQEKGLYAPQRMKVLERITRESKDAGSVNPANPSVHTGFFPPSVHPPRELPPVEAVPSVLEHRLQGREFSGGRPPVFFLPAGPLTSRAATS